MRFIIFFMITVLSIFSGQSITAEIKNDCKKDKNYPLRKADREKDVQSNILSNIQFSTTNFGPVFYGSGSSLVWPRGSKNQYIIDAGLWFGCQKKFGDSLKAQVMIANDTRTGNSQMVPGRIKDGDAMIENKPAYYRIYFSSDMDEDGYPFYPDDGPNWPLWNKKTKNAFSPGGVFIPDTLQRNRHQFREDLFLYPMKIYFVLIKIHTQNIIMT